MYVFAIYIYFYRAGAELEKYVIDLCKELNLPYKPSDMNTDV